MNSLIANDIFLLLGSNQGNAIGNLEIAKKYILEKIGVLQRLSSFYKTAAWGETDQPDFYNQVLIIQTILDAEQLLEKTLSIEQQMGRTRTKKWSPRIIDIDILFFDQQIINSGTLQVPHPAIPMRRFTLVPLVEVAPDFIHPVHQKNMRTLLLECPDTLPVDIIDFNNR